MELGPYAAFILWAYAAAGLVLAAVVAWLVLDWLGQRRHLAELEGRGVTRRSAGGASHDGDTRDRT